MCQKKVYLDGEQYITPKFQTKNLQSSGILNIKNLILLYSNLSYFYSFILFFICPESTLKKRFKNKKILGKNKKN